MKATKYRITVYNVSSKGRPKKLISHNISDLNLKENCKIYSSSISYDNQRIVCVANGEKYNEIIVFSIVENKKLYESGRIRSRLDICTIRFHPCDVNRIMSAGKSHLRVWSMTKDRDRKNQVGNNEKTLLQLNAHIPRKPALNCIDFDWILIDETPVTVVLLSKGDLIVLQLKDDKISFSLPIQKIKAPLPLESSPLMRISNDEQTIMLSGNNGKIAILKNIKRGEEICNFRTTLMLNVSGERISALAIMPRGSIGEGKVACSTESDIGIFNLQLAGFRNQKTEQKDFKNFKKTYDMQLSYLNDKAWHCSKFNSNSIVCDISLTSNVIVSASHEDSTIRVFNAQTQKLQYTENIEKFGKENLFSISIHNWLLAVSSMKCVYYILENQLEKCVFLDVEEPIRCVKFSSSGHCLATSTCDSVYLFFLNFLSLQNSGGKSRKPSLKLKVMNIVQFNWLENDAGLGMASYENGKITIWQSNQSLIQSRTNLLEPNTIDKDGIPLKPQFLSLVALPNHQIGVFVYIGNMETIFYWWDNWKSLPDKPAGMVLLHGEVRRAIFVENSKIIIGFTSGSVHHFKLNSEHFSVENKYMDMAAGEKLEFPNINEDGKQSVHHASPIVCLAAHGDTVVSVSESDGLIVTKGCKSFDATESQLYKFPFIAEGTSLDQFQLVKRKDKMIQKDTNRQNVGKVKKNQNVQNVEKEKMEELENECRRLVEEMNKKDIEIFKLQNKLEKEQATLRLDETIDNNNSKSDESIKLYRMLQEKEKEIEKLKIQFEDYSISMQDELTLRSHNHKLWKKEFIAKVQEKIRTEKEKHKNEITKLNETTKINKVSNQFDEEENEILIQNLKSKLKIAEMERTKAVEESMEAKYKQDWSWKTMRKKMKTIEDISNKTRNLLLEQENEKKEIELKLEEYEMKYKKLCEIQESERNKKEEGKLAISKLAEIQPKFNELQRLNDKLKARNDFLFSKIKPKEEEIERMSNHMSSLEKEGLQLLSKTRSQEAKASRDGVKVKVLQQNVKDLKEKNQKSKNELVNLKDEIGNILDVSDVSREKKLKNKSQFKGGYRVVVERMYRKVSDIIVHLEDDESRRKSIRSYAGDGESTRRSHEDIVESRRRKRRLNEARNAKKAHSLLLSQLQLSVMTATKAKNVAVETAKKDRHKLIKENTKLIEQINLLSRERDFLKKEVRQAQQAASIAKTDFERFRWNKSQKKNREPVFRKQSQVSQKRSGKNVEEDSKTWEDSGSLIRKAVLHSSPSPSPLKSRMKSTTLKSSLHRDAASSSYLKEYENY
eukprot:g2869.t1